MALAVSPARGGDGGAWGACGQAALTALRVGQLQAGVGDGLVWFKMLNVQR